MATNESTGPLGDVGVTPRSAMERRWGWLLALGIVQVLCGAFAVAIPIAASLAAAIVFGAVLLVAGVFQTVHAFSIRPWKGAVLHALGGVFYIVAGLFSLLFPLTGALTLTILVGVLMVADGIARSVLAYRIRPKSGWGWFLSSGIASTVVGVLLLVGWPLTGLWAIGILLGVNLLFSGVGYCALAITFRTRNARNPETQPA